MGRSGKFLSHVVFWGVISAFAAVVLFVVVFFYYSRQLPDPNAWQDRKVIQSTKIYDRDAKICFTKFTAKKNEQ